MTSLRNLIAWVHHSPQIISGRSGVNDMAGASRKITSIAMVLLLIFIAHEKELFQSLWGLNEAQGIALNILLIAALLWITELVPLFVTSFIIIGLQVGWLLPVINASGKIVDSQAFLSPFFSNIILLFLGGFVLSATLHKYDLDKKFARWILCRTGKSPTRLLVAVIFISAFFSMWMSNTATAAMMFAIVLPIISRIPNTNHFSKALALSIPFACNLGGFGTPIGSPPNAIALSYLYKNGVNLSFANWMMMCLPVMLILLSLLWWTLLKLYPPKNLEVSLEEESNAPLSRAQISVIIIFLLTCIGWLTTDLHGLSIAMISLFPIVVCFGFRLLSNQDFQLLSWDLLFMLGGGLCLGVGLQSSGLTDKFLLLLTQDAHYQVMLLTIASLGLIMSTFISNTATANLILPLVVSLDSNIGVIAVTVALVCSSAMALPVSTPPNAIAFGSGVLHSKDMLIAGLVVSILAFLIILLFGEFYWPILRFF